MPKSVIVGFYDKNMFSFIFFIFLIIWVFLSSDLIFSAFSKFVGTLLLTSMDSGLALHLQFPPKEKGFIISIQSSPKFCESYVPKVSPSLWFSLSLPLGQDHLVSETLCNNLSLFCNSENCTLLFFCWRIIALQCCVSFCWPMRLVRYMYTSVPSLLCCAQCPNPRAGREKASKTVQLAKGGSLLLTRARALCHIQHSGAGQRAPSPSCYTNL